MSNSMNFGGHFENMQIRSLRRHFAACQDWFLDLAYQITPNQGVKVNKGAKIRNRYNHVPHLTQDTSGKVTNSQLDTTKDSQEVSPFPAGDHKAHINRRAQIYSKHKTEKNIKEPKKKYRLGTVSRILYWRA